MPECYIRGSTIKYLRIPDEVIDMVKEDAQVTLSETFLGRFVSIKIVVQTKSRGRQDMNKARNNQNQRNRPGNTRNTFGQRGGRQQGQQGQGNRQGGGNQSNQMQQNKKK